MKAQALVILMYPHRRVVGALVLTISASRSEQMYHTYVFSLSGCRSVFVATRRRSSQATGPLVAALWRLTTLVNISRTTKICQRIKGGYDGF